MKLQLTILSSVLQLMLLATIFNINGGVALFPMQLLFCKFFVVVTVVIGFIADVPDPGVMQRPPRKPGTRIVHPPQIVRWVISGFVVAVSALAVLAWGPGRAEHHDAVDLDDDGVRHRRAERGEPRPRDAPRARARGSSPVFPYLGWIILGWALTWAAVELTCSSACSTPSRSPGGSGRVVIGLSWLAPAFVAVDKAVQVRRLDREARVGMRPRPARRLTPSERAFCERCRRSQP